jgi:TetR/AcrR family transcriptional repressor of lmrAB and yxaGH operons
VPSHRRQLVGRLIDTPRPRNVTGAGRSSTVDGRTVLAEAIAARGPTGDEARRLATLVVAAIEGGLVLARATRTTEPLLTVGDELRALLGARL